MRRMAIDIFCGLNEEDTTFEVFFGRNALDHEDRLSQKEFHDTIE